MSNAYDHATEATEISMLEDQLDPTLCSAIRRYFDRRRIAVLERLIPGEQEYKGAWKGLELHELRQMLSEEVDDEDAYTAMFEWRRDIDGAL